MNIDFQSVVPAPSSLCMLFQLNVRKNGQITVWASPHFMTAISARLGARRETIEKETSRDGVTFLTEQAAGSVLRVNDFDFMAVKRNRYVGVCDDAGEGVYERAMQVANHMLSAYRSMLLFERVFSEKGSYQNYILFHRRPPSVRHLLQMAEEKGIHIPYLQVPFTSPLVMEAGPATPPSPIKTKVFIIKKDGHRLSVKPRLAPSPKLLALAQAVNSRYGH